jgi:hypothetical protein
MSDLARLKAILIHDFFFVHQFMDISTPSYNIIHSDIKLILNPHVYSILFNQIILL